MAEPLRIVVASFAVASSSVVALPTVVASLVAVATLVAVAAACSRQIAAEIVVEYCCVACCPAGTHSAVAGTHFLAGALPWRIVCRRHSAKDTVCNIVVAVWPSRLCWQDGDSFVVVVGFKELV